MELWFNLIVSCIDHRKNIHQIQNSWKISIIIPLFLSNHNQGNEAEDTPNTTRKRVRISTDLIETTSTNYNQTRELMEYNIDRVDTDIRNHTITECKDKENNHNTSIQIQINLNSKLIKAIQTNDLDEVRILLANGANVNTYISGIGPPLYLAARINNLEAVQLLLELRC